MPNLTNYVTRTETSRAEQEKLVKIFDLLVSLTISEEEVGQASSSIDMWSITVCAVENTVYIMEVCVVILLLLLLLLTDVSTDTRTCLG